MTTIIIITPTPTPWVGLILRKVVEMIWVVVLTVLLVILAASGLPQAVWSLYRKWKAVRDIPGWPTHWFWGNLNQLGGDEVTTLKFIHYV